MNIMVTGRHVDVSDRLRDYAERKIRKLDRYFNQLIDAHVIFISEKVDRIAEVVINGDGVRLHGKESAADFFSAVDLLFEKMEAQIRRHKEKHQMHKGPEKGDIAVSAEDTMDEGVKVVLRPIGAKPLDHAEAYLRMKTENRVFILYRKGDDAIDTNAGMQHRNHAVMFRDGDRVRLVEFRGGSAVPGHCLFFDVKVIDDSASNPNIEFIATELPHFRRLTLHEAIRAIHLERPSFLPFYNTESESLNIIYPDADGYEVLVPS